MFQHLSDYSHLDLSISPVVNSTNCNYWNCSPFAIAILYLNRHGSLVGFDFGVDFSYPLIKSDAMHPLDMDWLHLILQNDVLSDHLRRDLYIFFLKCRPNQLQKQDLSPGKYLRCILTEGMEVVDRKRQPQVSTSPSVLKRLSHLLGPALILETIRIMDEPVHVKFLLDQFKELTSKLIGGDNGIVIFQHVVNFALAQSHRHLAMMKLLAERYQANPNVLVPVRHDIVDCQVLNQRYYKALANQPSNTLKDVETWNIGQQVGSFGVRIQGYSVLHLITMAEKVVTCDKRLAYLLKEAPLLAEPFIKCRSFNTDGSLQRPKTAIDTATSCLYYHVLDFYINEIFPTFVNQLVLVDQRIRNDNNRWITPLMLILVAYDFPSFLEPYDDDLQFRRMRILMQECKADVNVRDSAGETVLMRAIRDEQLIAVEHLVALSDKHDWEAVDKEIFQRDPSLRDILWEISPSTFKNKKRPFPG
jgi:hypothetical protein